MISFLFSYKYMQDTKCVETVYTLPYLIKMKFLLEVNLDLPHSKKNLY
jgi:hypothetical protein